jgi:hypothetical protein
MVSWVNSELMKNTAEIGQLRCCCMPQQRSDGWGLAQRVGRRPAGSRWSCQRAKASPEGDCSGTGADRRVPGFATGTRRAVASTSWFALAVIDYKISTYGGACAD